MRLVNDQRGKNIIDFNSRTPCGVRRGIIILPFKWIFISTHALLAECDVILPPQRRNASLFQLTHSLRSATELTEDIIMSAVDFNSRTPCGVRRQPAHRGRSEWSFQLTHSLRSATGTPNPKRSHFGISTHALLAECDRFIETLNKTQKNFNSRTPCGVRPSSGSYYAAPNTISTHALLAECDASSPPSTPTASHFNSRTPCGVRPERSPLLLCRPEFQLTHSLRSATN